VHTRQILNRGFQSLRNLVRPDLGPLEHRVMEVLWQDGEANVRDVHEKFGDGVAYTTVMTTLDRLFKKGLLRRWKVGRAFHYAPLASREESQRSLAAEVMEGLLAQHQGEPLPLLSNLVDAVGDADQRLLDDLARLVQEKRARLRNGGAS
jgi:BlaI family transcriptional regulator, penicillinase repressor